MWLIDRDFFGFAVAGLLSSLAVLALQLAGTPREFEAEVQATVDAVLQSELQAEREAVRLMDFARDYAPKRPRMRAVRRPPVAVVENAPENAPERLRWPVDTFRITSRFGSRTHPLSGALDTHDGVDLAAAFGTRVSAVADGRIEFAGHRPGYGNHVVIRHAGSWRTVYAHLSSFGPDIQAGARVGRGDPIGRVGMSGAATGPHLHFEVRDGNRPVDPMRATAFASAHPPEAQLRSDNRR